MANNRSTLNNTSLHSIPLTFIPMGLIKYVDNGVGNGLVSKICQYNTQTDGVH